MSGKPASTHLVTEPDFNVQVTDAVASDNISRNTSHLPVGTLVNVIVLAVAFAIVRRS